jgi:hypothetical protein
VVYKMAFENAPMLTPRLFTAPVQTFRRSRPPFSPQKQLPAPPTPLRRATTESPEKSTPCNSIVPQVNPTPSHLTFEEFTFEDGQRSLQRIEEEHEQLLQDTLRDNYSVIEMQIEVPFLILYCKTIPDSETWPLRIAGCVAIWRHEDDASPSDLIPGTFGRDSDTNNDPELAS